MQTYNGGCICVMCMCILRMCLHLHILTLPVWLAVRCRFHEELSVYSMRFTLKSKLKIYALAWES